MSECVRHATACTVASAVRWVRTCCSFSPADAWPVTTAFSTGERISCNKPYVVSVADSHQDDDVEHTKLTEHPECSGLGHRDFATRIASDHVRGGLWLGFYE